MNKYEHIITQDIVDDKIIKEVNLWRAVVIQHLIDLASNANDKTRNGGFRRAAFEWIFGQKLIVKKDGNLNYFSFLENINNKTNGNFHEVCEMAHLDALSVKRQAIAILKNQYYK